MRYRPLPPGSLATLAGGLLVVLGLGYLLLFPPGPPPDSTWHRIQQEKVVRIGLDPSFPHFEVDDGRGNLSGYDIALAAALARKWDVQVKYVYVGFDGLYDALDTRQFDMILSALPYNPVKTRDFYFSQPYFNGGPIVVVQEKDTQIGGPGDLGGRRVAVEMGTSGDTWARRWQRRLDLQLAELDTPDQVLQSVVSGQTSAALVDPVSFYSYVRARRAPLKKVSKPLTDENYVIAVRMDENEVLEAINKAIDELKQNGTLEQLERQWF